MRVGMIDRQAIRQRWESVGSRLDERGRRAFAAGEVRAAGWGGLEAVSAITGLARSTIGRGLKDLDAAHQGSRARMGPIYCGDIPRFCGECQGRVAGGMSVHEPVVKGAVLHVLLGSK
jgi:hypothetical protein